MNRTTFISTVAASIFGLSGMANAAVLDGSSFTTKAEILGTAEINLPGFLPDIIDDLSVSLTQGGTVDYGVDNPADSQLAFVGLDLGLASVDLGVLGVDWITDTTFDLVFDLSATLDVLGISTTLPLGFDGTIDWDITSIDLGAGEYINGVTQINGPNTSSLITWTNNSIQIDSATVLGLDFSGTRQRFELTTGIDDITPVPLPAALPMLLVGMGGLAFVSRRRKGAAPKA